MHLSICMPPHPFGTPMFVKTKSIGFDPKMPKGDTHTPSFFLLVVQLCAINRLTIFSSDKWVKHFLFLIVATAICLQKVLRIKPRTSALHMSSH